MFSHVISALGIEKLLDVIITADEVTLGKPDPQIYLLVAQKLKVKPFECLVLEDSVNGIKAGLAAGMSVIAIATPFTKTSILQSNVIPDKWIVKDLKKIAEIVQDRITQHNQTSNQ